jgi:diphthamide synthase (EF-2-diphthine--ammonia ligase)
MQQFLDSALAQGVTHMAFGDLFLAEIRAYRERQLAGTGITPVFPLWGADTLALGREMIAAGLRAVVATVDPRHLPREFAGQGFDALMARLPANVDPCGENGEFHTFCYAGPMFAAPVAWCPGEIVERDGFVFADLIPQQDGWPCA